MKQIVSSNQELCVGCNRCIRECPMELANETYQDENGNIRVKVNHSKCIACGNCILACKHNARFYRDDLQEFLNDLLSGDPISVIVAPAIRTNFPEYKKLFSWLKSLGVHNIFDVSLGADICIWAHIRYIEQYNPSNLITQPCPPVVSYCEMHNNELLKYLSPVQSPMSCTAILMKTYQDISGKIAAFSPCIAKSNEFLATNMIDYNITFASLTNYLQDNSIEFPAFETEFDNIQSTFGAIFPNPGGLKEYLSYLWGKSIRIDQAEGIKIYDRLADYAKSSPNILPRVFDVLNCPDGCNNGSGCMHNKNHFQIQSVMDSSRQSMLANYDHEFYVRLHEKFDNYFDLEHFLRTYNACESPGIEISDEEIDHAFKLLDKESYADRNFNCGACGSETCLDMARKIALKTNIPMNCIVKSRNDLRNEHQKYVEQYERNTNFIELVHKIGNILLSAEPDRLSDVVNNSLQELCLTLKGHSANIWKAFDEDDQLYCKKIYSWSSNPPGKIKIVYYDWFPDWFDMFMRGEPVKKIKPFTSHNEETLFFDRNDTSIVAMPMMVAGVFWGLISIHKNDEILVDDEESSVILACGLLIISSIVEKESTESKIATDELVKKLELASQLDSLTGIYNRRHIFSSIDEEMRYAYENGNSLTLCMIDLDYFKNINDRFGHVYGDKVLVGVAQIIAQHLDSDDIFGRYGGEEFIILFRNTDLESALKKTYAFMDAVRNTTWEEGAKLTISCGISTYKKGIFFSNFIEIADRNLYKAKFAGRDRVIY